MRPGYLYLETHREHPGMVRIVVSTRSPEPLRDSGEPTRIRYIARFKDVDTGRMHFQNALHRHLVNIDEGLYQSSISEAIAAIEADHLDHTREWVDPSLGAEEYRRMSAISAKWRHRHARSDRLWRMVGAGAVTLLIARALGVF